MLWRRLVAVLVMVALIVPIATGGRAQADFGNDGIDTNCDDFPTHAAAQAYFLGDGGSAARNVDDLDRDNDGLACENRPGGPGGAPPQEGAVTPPTVAPTEPAGAVPTVAGSPVVPAPTKPVGGAVSVSGLPSTGTGGQAGPGAWVMVVVLAGIAVAGASLALLRRRRV